MGECIRSPDSASLRQQNLGKNVWAPPWPNPGSASEKHFLFSLLFCSEYPLDLYERYYFRNIKLHKNVKFCGNQKWYQVVSVYYPSSSGDSVVFIKVSNLIKGHLTSRSNHMRTHVCRLPNYELANGTAQFAQFLSEPYLRPLSQFFNTYQ